jgi:nucleoid-associated protein YgaU
VLERHGAPAVDDDDVTPYWRTLVAANRELLPVPTNPDLLFPGDRLVVPPVPSAR